MASIVAGVSGLISLLVILGTIRVLERIFLRETKDERNTAG